jgi:hypothetical protein
MRNAEIIIDHFLDFCVHYLEMRTKPAVIVINDKKWSVEKGTFGIYVPSEDKFTINIYDRHIMDILRTVAHEMVHAKQREEGVSDAPRDIIEIQANRLGSMLIKVFGKKHPSYFGN